MTKQINKSQAKSQLKTARKEKYGNKLITDPKIDALLQKYELPKTIFYHATESQILKLLKHQALHHRLLADSHSPMKQFNDNRLAPATEKRRRLNQNELKRKWTDNIGIPLSVKSTLSNSEMIEFIFRLYRDQASLAKIKNGHSPYAQFSRSKSLSKSKPRTFSQKTKHEQYRETSERTKKRRLMAYTTLRKVVFETYASGNKNKSKKANYLIPQAPKTARKSRKSSVNRKFRSRKNKSEATLFSKHLKTEMTKLCEKKDTIQKKRTEIRMVQSARKHKPVTTVTKKQHNGSVTTRTVKKTNDSASSESISIVDKILNIAHTKEANKKYGNTVPAFRTAFVQEMYQYSKQRLQNKNQEKGDVESEPLPFVVKQQPSRPEFKCPVGPAKIFSGRRASAFNEFGRRETNFDESNYIRRQAYDKMVKQTIKVKTQPQTNCVKTTTKQAEISEASEASQASAPSEASCKVPQLNLEDVKSSQ